MKLFQIFNSLTIVIVLGILPSSSAFAAKRPWTKLTPVQQEALAPVAGEWDTMEERLQKRLLATTTKYPKFSVKQKQRFQTRLTEWSKLTPEQRNRAREKYKAYSKIPSDKREEMKRMVLQKEAEKMSAASSVAETPEE